MEDDASTPPNYELPSGQKILVVGACTKLGAEVAQCLARTRAILGLVDMRNIPGKITDEMVALCKSAGAQKVSYCATHPSSAGEWTSAVGELVRFMGGIDVLCYLDGSRFESPFKDLGDTSQALRMLEHNCFAPIFALSAAISPLKSVNGQFLYIGNLSESLREPESTFFTASKLATEAFLKRIREEEENLTVSLVHPGVKLEGLSLKNELLDSDDKRRFHSLLAAIGDTLKDRKLMSFVRGQYSHARGRSLSFDLQESQKVSVTVANHIVPTPPAFDSSDAPEVIKLTNKQDKIALKELLKGLKSNPSICLAVDSHGRTALHYAAQSGNWEIAAMLLKPKKKSPLNVADSYRWTPLHVAAKQGHLGFVRKLVKAGADPNALTAGNMAAMHFIARFVPPAANPKAAQLLEHTMRTLVDVGADSNQRNVNWSTPLHEAARCNSTVAARFLMKVEGDVLRKTKNENVTPLHYAVKNANKELVDIFLKAGADPSVVSDMGSCFDLASSGTIREMLEEYREKNRRPDSDFENNKEREVIVIKSLRDLPEEAQRLLTQSELTDENLIMKNHDIFFYALRFLTRKTYKLASDNNEEMTEVEKERERQRRRPKSKSTLDLTLEEAGEKYLKSGNPRRMFKIIEDAGRGGFGTVYQARSLADKRRVAIKRLPHLSDKEQWSNFDEIHFLTESKHSCVVKYYETYYCRDEIWMVMEYLEGGSLSEAVSRYKLEEDHIAYVTHQILRGLRTMHKQNFVHRDLKSANIMLSITGDVKLIDFGLCADVRKGPLVNLVGSPFWIPPEMIRHQPHGCPADIWSLAILCLEMANGKPPNRRSALKAMFTIGIGEIPWFEDETKWSSEFHAFMRRCLVIDPNQRATANDLISDPWIQNHGNDKRGMKDVLHHIFIEKSLESSLGL